MKTTEHLNQGDNNQINSSAQMKPPKKQTNMSFKVKNETPLACAPRRTKPNSGNYDLSFKIKITNNQQKHNGFCSIEVDRIKIAKVIKILKL